MKHLILLAALALAGHGAAAAQTPARAPATTDWRTVVGTATSGGYTTGNPAAKVKLVEYLSFTCPHCAHFVIESRAGLRDGLVKDGLVATETRAAVRDAFDLAAWTVARCAGPRRFDAVTHAIFTQQAQWIKQARRYVEKHQTELKPLPLTKQVGVVIAQSGLGTIAAKTGVAPAALNACAAKPATQDALIAMTRAGFAKISGTPAFEIDGQLQAVVQWSELEPLLRAKAGS